MEPQGSNASFGLWVLAATEGRHVFCRVASDDGVERTEIRFDLSTNLIMVDRRYSRQGQSNDTDIRAGPWPRDPTTGLLATELSLHVFVDRGGRS